MTDNTTQPKVGVVILNFKVKDLTLKCIKSIQKSNYENIELIIVDNNSGDDLENQLPKEGNIHFIQTGQNLGYTGGNNTGIKKALDLNCQFVFILNPDTELDSGCISQLVQASTSTDAGIAGPKILFGDKKTIWYAGGIFDLKNVLGSHRGVNELDKGQYDQLQETQYVSGGAMFVRSEVFDKVGMFDPRYFLYYEDSDLCFRASKAGFKILYVPSAVVYHANAKSTGLGSPLQDYFITRNRLLFASKFLSLRTRFAILREAVRNSKMETRKMAFKDFMTGKFGKGSFIKD